MLFLAKDLNWRRIKMPEFEVTKRYKIEANDIDEAVENAEADIYMICRPKSSYKVEGDNQIVEWEEK